MKTTVLLILALLAGPAPAIAADYELKTVAADLDYPWSVAFLPTGDLLVTELGGQLRRIGANGNVGPPLAGVPEVYHKAQGGLFDVLLHPDFALNQTLFLSYAQGTAAANGTAIARAHLTDSGLENLKVIYRAGPSKDTPVHYGGRMAFLPDGTLLVTVGDGFDYREAAQDLGSQLGKTLRITTEGEPAPGNPFPHAPLIWSYGHRNAQGLVVAPDGTVWLHEHGPRGGDEINQIQPGTNYGWPAITHGVDYSGARISPYTHWDGMAQPLLHWTPSIAPSGFAIYTGDRFAQWRGDLFVGALVAHELRRIDMENGVVIGQESLLTELDERIRDVRMGPDGALYVITDGPGGKVLRLIPAP